MPRTQRAEPQKPARGLLGAFQSEQRAINAVLIGAAALPAIVGFAIAHSPATEMELHDASVDVASSVLFNGADAQPVRSGKVTTYPPLTQDNGKRVHFMFGWTRDVRADGRTGHDLLPDLRPTIDDDILTARKLGFTVVLDEGATRDAFKTAVGDDRTAALIWMGHGLENSPGVVGADFKQITTETLAGVKASKNLKLVVFESCKTGLDKTWASKLNGATVVSWDYDVLVRSLKNFNTPNGRIDDLLSRTPTELDDYIRTLR